MIMKYALIHYAEPIDHEEELVEQLAESRNKKNLSKKLYEKVMWYLRCGGYLEEDGTPLPQKGDERWEFNGHKIYISEIG